MTVEMAVDILNSVLGMALTLLSPILGTAIVVGVSISLLQSITSVQEQTLTFVPKLVAVGVVIMISANWMIRTTMEFAIGFIQRLPEMAR